jgi:hypothetical protein
MLVTAFGSNGNGLAYWLRLKVKPERFILD